MREWPGFSTGDSVGAHVIRSLPRDYETFSRMQPGDQYPQAYDVAVQIYKEKLEGQNSHASTLCSVEQDDLWSKIVPPYDPGKFPNKWWKLDPKRPSKTLTAHIGKDTYSHIHYDSKQARTISVREAARLQSFPDGFQFAGAMNAAFRQIGNAVPPLLALAVARHVRRQLSKAVQLNEALAQTSS
jgi:DNA (cytosine-5)-methyltransferase 1